MTTPWTFVFLPFFGAFILSAAFALPVSAVFLAKSAARSAIREINV